jgi:hypothetical protein
LTATVAGGAPDANPANDSATYTVQVPPLPRLAPLRVRFLSARRAGTHRRRLTGARIRGAAVSARVTITCAAGCGRGAKLLAAGSGPPHGVLRLRFARRPAVRRGLRLVVAERLGGHAPRTQRYRF